MVNTFKNIWKWIKKNRNENSEESLEEEEYDKFLLKIEKRMDKIKGARKAQTHEARAQIGLMVENAYTQKKMVDVSNSLREATWILALATIAFTIGTVYGVAQLNNIMMIALQIIGLLIIALLAFVVLKGIWKIVKLLYARFGNKKILK
jgi:hypothetical protein